MRYALVHSVTRRTLSRAPTAHAAGVLAREHAEWCRQAGFRATPYGLALDGRRVPKGSADWGAFEAGRAGEPEPVAKVKRRRFVRRAA